MIVTIFRPLSIIALLITFASCSTESTDEPTPAASADYVVDNNYDYSAIELQVAELINQYRTSKGLKILNHSFVKILKEQLMLLI